MVDAALRSIPGILPVLDFSTIKNELFPVVAAIFSKTNSLSIKVRGLQAFVILCGGSNDGAGDDGLDGLNGLDGLDRPKTTSSSSVLDKYTMQEKIVPLVRAIKTKEPVVMMAALGVLRVVGRAADADFVAMDILPILWSMSLGPLLDLKQFHAFMGLIKSLSRRVEEEQTKKLQELSGNTNGVAPTPTDDFMSFGGVTGTQFDATTGDNEDDFERLVKGKSGSPSTNPMDGGWDSTALSAVTSPGISKPSKTTPQAATFSWSTQTATTATPISNPFGAVKTPQPSFRTVTPDLASITSLAPASTQFSQPLQPTTTSTSPIFSPPATSSNTAINWSSTIAPTANPWTSTTSTPPLQLNSSLPHPAPGFGSGLQPSMPGIPLRPSLAQSQSSSFSLPPPPGRSNSGPISFSLAPPPGASRPGVVRSGLGMAAQGTNNLGMGMTGNSNTAGMTSLASTTQPQAQPQQQQRSGLDKYPSLIN